MYKDTEQCMQQIKFLFIPKNPDWRTSDDCKPTRKEWKEQLRKYPKWDDAYEFAFGKYQACSLAADKGQINRDKVESKFVESTFREIPVSEFTTGLSLRDISYSKGYERCDMVSSSVFLCNSKLTKDIDTILWERHEGKEIILDVELLQIAVDYRNLFMQVLELSPERARMNVHRFSHF